MPNSRASPWPWTLERARRVVAWASARDLWFCVALLAVVLALVFRPVWAQSGWPKNQELLNWKYRLAIYAAHARRFDFFPIWSESMAFGLGAPGPILYHKLFYLFALPLYLLLGSTKAAITAALACFSVIGLLGTSSLCRFLGAPQRASFIAAAALLFCNYAYTDWVVRGAFAEYSAMMLLPWMYRWCAGVLEGERAQRLARSGALIFPALYLAHSLLFFFAAPLVLGAVAWRFARAPERKEFLRALMVIGGVFALIALPIVVCQVYVVRELSFAEGIAVFEPKNYFGTLTQYLTGGDFAWGRNWDAYSVQLDMPLVIIALVLLVGTLAHRLRARTAPGSRAERSTPADAAADAATPQLLPVRAHAAGWLSVAYFGLLQSRISEPLYAVVPGFSALQFPWRLLAFTSVLSVTLAAVPLLRGARFGKRDDGSLFAWVLLLVTYVSSPWMHEIRYPWYSARLLEGPTPPEIAAGAFEYHPRVQGVPGKELINYTYQLQPPYSARHWTEAAYAVQRLDEPGFETGVRSYRVSAREPSTVVLPVAYSPFIRVHGADRTRRLATYRTAVDPRVHVQLPAGVTQLDLQLPTLLSFYWDLLTRGGERNLTPGS